MLVPPQKNHFQYNCHCCCWISMYEICAKIIFEKSNKSSSKSNFKCLTNVWHSAPPVDEFSDRYKCFLQSPQSWYKCSFCWTQYAAGRWRSCLWTCRSLTQSTDPANPSTEMCFQVDISVWYCAQDCPLIYFSKIRYFQRDPRVC